MYHHAIRHSLQSDSILSTCIGPLDAKINRYVIDIRNAHLKIENQIKKKITLISNNLETLQTS